ncbi:MAG TPA: hypothetical protein VLV83_05885 [Acidobacteriota bacterium]|nr:hypothetical protein [Acidobacteriota bacterium]
MRVPLSIALASCMWASALFANDTTAIPVREVTVFKDGHAFILHEGQVPTDEQGDVVLDSLPEPVLGTFWPYSADPSVALAGVVAGRRTLSTSRDAVTLVELLMANTGKRALISENSGASYEAVIRSVPRWTDPGSDAEKLGDVILFQTDDGTRVAAMNRVRDVTFLEEPETSWTHSQTRNLLELDLDWKGKSPAAAARVGMVYLQKGIRWIPTYKVELDEGGTARIRLQATLLNEITDLEDTTVHLVIGVPSFAFKNNLDPIVLQDTAAQLSRHFRSDERTAHAFSNALTTQVAYTGIARTSGDSGDENRGGELSGSAKQEDLFIFTVEHISLKKGERMVVPITDFELEYEDVFTLDLPFAPPPEVRTSVSQTQAALARQMSKPIVRHNIRLSNDSSYPLTTAPALVLRDGRLLAQGLMSYTAIGGTCDLEAGDAVDIQVRKNEEEVRRLPNAVVWRNDVYAKVELEGSVELTNRRGTPVRLEVTRWVLGNVDGADNDGKVTRINQFEDGDFLPPGGLPRWWGSYSWPSWWRHFNGISRISWTFDLPHRESADLGYDWHYFWR